jgi:SAM-dependent methyltransferase
LGFAPSCRLDPSAGYLHYAASHVSGRAAVAVATATALPLADARVDWVVSGLVLNFVPAPAVALEQATRVVRPKGEVACYVWDYAEGMQMMRYFWNAACDLDPSARDLAEGVRFPLCRAEPLHALAQTVLEGVEVTEIVISTLFRDFDDYWDDYWAPFLGRQGPAPATARPCRRTVASRCGNVYGSGSPSRRPDRFRSPHGRG